MANNQQAQKPKTKWLVPELKANEILAGFKESGLDWITLDMITKPTAKSVQNFYQWLLITLFRSSSNPCHIPTSVVNNLEHSQVYLSSLSLLNLYRQCQQLAKNILILDDFQLRHLTKPDPVSFKKQCCYILYFIKFYNGWFEEVSKDHIEPGIEKERLNIDLKEKKFELQNELENLIEENENNSESIQATLNDIEAQRENNQNLAQQCTLLKAENETLKKERDEHLNLIKDHYNYKIQLESDIDELQAKVFDNPEEKKQEIANLRHNILEIKEKLSRIEERKKLLHNIQDHYNLIQKDISGSTKTATEAIQSRRQLKEIEKGLNNLKTEFNRYQTKRSSLNEDIRLLKLKKSNLEDNISKNSESLRKRLEYLEGTYNQTQETQKIREIEDIQFKGEIDKINSEIEIEKRKGLELLNTFDKAVRDGKNIAQLVNKQTQSYNLSVKERLIVPE